MTPTASSTGALAAIKEQSHGNNGSAMIASAPVSGSSVGSSSATPSSSSRSSDAGGLEHAPAHQADGMKGDSMNSKAVPVPLVDLYSGSAADSVDADEELKQAIIQGLTGDKNPIVPGDVHSAGTCVSLSPRSWSIGEKEEARS